MSPSAGYLTNLLMRLGAGIEWLEPERMRRHAAFLHRNQSADGGFAGREAGRELGSPAMEPGAIEPAANDGAAAGDAPNDAPKDAGAANDPAGDVAPGRSGAGDLYYTGFGVRALALLGELDPARAALVGRYLQSRLVGQAPIVDFLSLVLAAATLNTAAGIDVFAAAPAGWQTNVARALEHLRRPDGGYAKTPGGESSSVYHSFLVSVCQQALEIETPEPERLVAFARSRQRDDGGFVEMAAMRRSGVNPTAAAIGILSMHDALEASLRSDTVAFLVELQNEEGGWRANTRIPIADLLSTFTALVTLGDLGAANTLDLAAAARYATSLEAPGGGFHGAVWDGGLDVEYTFYGLGTLSLTSGPGRES